MFVAGIFGFHAAARHTCVVHQDIDATMDLRNIRTGGVNFT
jgi:hypothetical protein